MTLRVDHGLSNPNYSRDAAGSQLDVRITARNDNSWSTRGCRSAHIALVRHRDFPTALGP